MLAFVSSLANQSDSLTVVHEKFLNYKTRLQESVDYKDFMELDNKVKMIEKELESGNSKYSSEEMNDVLSQLKNDRAAAKMWWIKLNQFAIMNTQKINDRESKIQNPTSIPGIYGAKTVNFNINAPKQIETKGSD